MKIEPSYWTTGDGGDSTVDVTWHYGTAKSICDLNNKAEQELQARDERFYDPDWNPSYPEPLYSQQTINKIQSFHKELYSTILWLYRRLPKAYANPPHVDIVVLKLAQMLGENAGEIIAERKDV